MRLRRVCVTSPDETSAHHSAAVATPLSFFVSRVPTPIGERCDSRDDRYMQRLLHSPLLLLFLLLPLLLLCAPYLPLRHNGQPIAPSSLSSSPPSQQHPFLLPFAAAAAVPYDNDESLYWSDDDAAWGDHDAAAWATHSSDSFALGSLSALDSLRRQEQLLAFSTTGGMNPGDPCATGFTGLMCDECLPDFYSPDCLPCPSCGHGSCSDGVSGDGSCTCDSDWYGSSCDRFQPDPLLPLDVDAWGVQDQLLRVQLEATEVGYAFWSQVSSLPSRGTLWQTSDGSSTGSAVLAAGTRVTDPLNRLLYRPPPGAGLVDPDEAFDSFTFQVANENVGLVSSPATVRLFVLHRNLPPVLHLPSAAVVLPALQTGATVHPLWIADAARTLGAQFNLSDPDAGNTALMELNLTLAHGGFSLRTEFAYLDGLLDDASTSASWIARGNMLELQALMGSLLYTPVPLSIGSDTLTLRLSDLGSRGHGGALMTSGSVQIDVQRVNQPISLLVASSFTIPEDQPLSLSSLQLQDSDAFWGDVSLDFRVSNGTLNLPSWDASAYPTVLCTGCAGARNLALRGPLPTLNTLLASLRYQGDFHYFGPDTLQLRANDNGFTGLGAATEDARNVSITVSFVDYPPLAFDQVVSMAEDGFAVVQLSGDGIDPFAPIESLQFRVTVLPPSWCGTLYQVTPHGPRMVAAAPIASPSTLVSDAQRRVLMRLQPYKHGIALCSFRFSVTKPSGVVSSTPGEVRFDVSHANHAPLCAGSIDAQVYVGIDSVLTLQATEHDAGDSVRFLVDRLPDRGTLFQVLPNGRRGAAFTAPGVVQDTAGRVIFVNSTLEMSVFDLANEVYTSFSYLVTDGSLQSRDSCLRNLSLVMPTIPLAPPVFYSNIETWDTAVSFALDYSQREELRLQAVTILTLPARGQLFEWTVGGGVGSEIVSVPWTWFAPEDGSSRPTLWFRPVPLESGKPYAVLDYSLTASNGAESLRSTLTLDVLPIKHAPEVASATLRGLDPADPTRLRINASSLDNDPITLTIYAFPSSGTLTLLDGTVLTPSSRVLDSSAEVLYYPSAPSDGSPVWRDLFWVQAFGGGMSSSPSSIELLIGGQFLVPLAHDQNVSLVEGEQTLLIFSGTDLRGSTYPLTPWVTAIDVMRGGTLIHPDSIPVSLEGGATPVRLRSLVYFAPSVGFGADFVVLCFKMRSNEGMFSSEATLRISIEHVKSIPVAYSRTRRVTQDSIGLLTLEGSVLDRDSLNATIYNLPSSGELYTCRSTPITPSPSTPEPLFTYTNLADTLQWLGERITSVPYTVAAGCRGDFSQARLFYIPPPRTFGPLVNRGVLASLTFSVTDGELRSPSNATLDVVVDHVQFLPYAVSSDDEAVVRALVGYTSNSYHPDFDNDRVQVQSNQRFDAFPLYHTPRNQPVLLQLRGLDVDGVQLTYSIKRLPSNGTLHVAVEERMAIADDEAFSLPYIDLLRPTGYRMRRAPILADALIHDPTLDFSSRHTRLFYLPASFFYGNDSFTYSVSLPSAEQGAVDAQFAGAQSLQPATLQLHVDFVEFPPQLPSVPVIVTGGLNTPAFLQLSAWEPQGEPIRFHISRVPDTTIGKLYQIPEWLVFLGTDSNGTVRWEGQPPATGASYRWTAGNEGLTPVSPSPSARHLLAEVGVNTPKREVEVPFPLGAQLVLPVRNSTSSGNSSEVMLADTIEVTHPNAYLAFVPTFGASGMPATIEFLASNAQLSSPTPARLVVDIQKTWQPPRALTYERNIETIENNAVIIRLYYALDDTLDQRAQVLQIVSLPERGTLCEVTPRAGLAQPCGPAFGPSLGRGAPVVDPNERVVYMPATNEWGVNYASFSFSVTDSQDSVSPAASIGIDVLFENQPPTAVSQTRTLDFAVDPYKERVEVTLEASDPDNSVDELTFTLLSAPHIGYLNLTVWRQGMRLQQLVNQQFLTEYFATHGTSVLVNSTLESGEVVQHNEWRPAPFVLASRRMTFLTSGQGASYPYASWSFQVTDPFGRVSRGEWSLVVQCKDPLRPNVWSKGPVCIECPLGAMCSATGDALPKSAAGYWQSQKRVNATYTTLTLTKTQQPIYLLCTPASACASVDYGKDGCDASSGYMGRRCAECMPGFYAVEGRCSQCTKTSSNIALIAAFAGVAVVLAGGFVFVMTKLNVDLSFFAIALNFFQTVGTFKNFKLNWPESTSNTMMQIALVFNLNPDLLSVECWIPQSIFGLPLQLQYKEKWALIQSLPFLLTFVLFFSAGLMIVLRFGVGMLLRLCKRQDSASRPSTLTLLKQYAAGPLDLFFMSMALLLNVGFLILVLKALEMTACTAQSDGTLLLDAAPYLVCNEDWYPLWRSVAILMCVLYALGIPFFFTVVLFVLRPLNNTVQYGVLRLPPQWLGYTDEHVRLLRLSKRDSLSAFGSLQQRKAEMDTFMVRYNSLVEIYERDYYFYSLAIMLRNLGLSLIAVLLSNTPLYQAICAIMLLLVSLTIHLRLQPYRAQKRFNELETACLCCELLTLFIGLTFYARLDQRFVDARLHDPSYKYPGFTELCALGLPMSIAVCTAVMAWLLASQMRTPMLNWIHARRNKAAQKKGASAAVPHAVSIEVDAKVRRALKAAEVHPSAAKYLAPIPSEEEHSLATTQAEKDEMDMLDLLVSYLQKAAKAREKARAAGKQAAKKSAKAASDDMDWPVLVQRPVWSDPFPAPLPFRTWSDLVFLREQQKLMDHQASLRRQAERAEHRAIRRHIRSMSTAELMREAGLIPPTPRPEAAVVADTSTVVEELKAEDTVGEEEKAAVVQNEQWARELMAKHRRFTLFRPKTDELVSSADLPKPHVSTRAPHIGRRPKPYSLFQPLPLDGDVQADALPNRPHTVGAAEQAFRPSERLRRGAFKQGSRSLGATQELDSQLIEGAPPSQLNARRRNKHFLFHPSSIAPSLESPPGTAPLPASDSASASRAPGRWTLWKPSERLAALASDQNLHHARPASVPTSLTEYSAPVDFASAREVEHPYAVAELSETQEVSAEAARLSQIDLLSQRNLTSAASAVVTEEVLLNPKHDEFDRAMSLAASSTVSPRGESSLLDDDPSLLRLQSFSMLSANGGRPTTVDHTAAPAASPNRRNKYTLFAPLTPSGDKSGDESDQLSLDAPSVLNARRRAKRMLFEPTSDAEAMTPIGATESGAAPTAASDAVSAASNRPASKYMLFRPSDRLAALAHNARSSVSPTADGFDSLDHYLASSTEVTPRSSLASAFSPHSTTLLPGQWSDEEAELQSATGTADASRRSTADWNKRRGSEHATTDAGGLFSPSMTRLISLSHVDGLGSLPHTRRTRYTLFKPTETDVQPAAESAAAPPSRLNAERRAKRMLFHPADGNTTSNSSDSSAAPSAVVSPTSGLSRRARRFLFTPSTSNTVQPF